MIEQKITKYLSPLRWADVFKTNLLETVNYSDFTRFFSFKKIKNDHNEK